MKRIGYSFLGGMILTVIVFFSCVAGSLMFAEIGGPPGELNTAQKIVTFPLLWSTYLGEILFPETYVPLSKTPALFFYVAGCNILFYSAVVYLFYPVIKQLRSQEPQNSQPPAPPVF